MLGAEGAVPHALLALAAHGPRARQARRHGAVPSAGLVGGVYAPSLFMGAALGSAYGAARWCRWRSRLCSARRRAQRQAYARRGHGGRARRAICRVPLTAILLLFELTHDYRIIVPLMGTVGVASWVAGAAERGEGANVRERQANGQQANSPSYVAVEVPKGKAEGVVGRACSLSTTTTTAAAGGRAGGD